MPTALDNGQRSTPEQLVSVRILPSRGRRITVKIAALLAVAAIVALALIFAPASGAGTVTLVGNELDYTAADGETNVVSFGPGSTDQNTGAQAWFLTETGAPLVVGPGCTSVDGDTASCTYAQANDCDLFVAIHLGDGNDEAEGTTGNPCDLFQMTITGGGGDDVLSGGAYENSELLSGGPGDDRLTGDGLAGGNGDDILKGVVWENYLNGGPGADTIQGERLTDLIFGGPGNDEIDSGGPDLDDDDWVHGGRGKDHITGGPGFDHLFGDRGADSLLGGRGADVIVGGGGPDYLAGERGRDTLRARDGRRDRVLGGFGTDKARVDIGLDVVRGIERLF
jgi:Ca2+-binding RTX toxin-like protein